MSPQSQTATPDRRWIALGVLVAAQFMVVLDVAIVNVALPSIKTDLHFTQSSLQWVITAYALMFGGFLLLGGRMADLLGRRRLFIAGVALFTLSSLLAGFAWSEASLIAFRATQGLGGALLAPAALSILTTMFAEGRERNIALGVWGAVSGSGAAAGVLLGGLLTSWLAWSWIFFINVPVGIAVVALTPFLLRESRAELDHRHFDVAGATSITGGLMLLVYAMTRATQIGWGTAETIGLLVASAALIVAFVVIELRSKAPLLPMRIFRLRTLRGANVTAVLLGASVFSQFFLGTLYMQQVLHFSAIQTGVAYLPLTLTIIALAGVSQSAGHADRGPARPAGRARVRGRRAPPAHPAPAGRPLLLRPLPLVPDQRGRARLRVHPDDDRGADGRRGGRRGHRVGPAQHEPADRRRDRARGRLDDRYHLHYALRGRPSWVVSPGRSGSHARL